MHWKPLSSSITSYSSTGIAHNHNTNIYPQTLHMSSDEQNRQVVIMVMLKTHFIDVIMSNVANIVRNEHLTGKSKYKYKSEIDA